MWVTKLLISPVKKRIFVQKRPNLAQNWPFCPLLAYLVPCWWVGWWLWCGLYLARHLFALFSGPTHKNNLCPPNPTSPQLVSPHTSHQCIQQAGSPVGDNVFDRTYKSLSDMLCVEFEQTDIFFLKTLCLLDLISLQPLW